MIVEIKIKGVENRFAQDRQRNKADGAPSRKFIIERWIGK